MNWTWCKCSGPATFKMRDDAEQWPIFSSVLKSMVRTRTLTIESSHHSNGAPNGIICCVKHVPLCICIRRYRIFSRKPIQPFIHGRSGPAIRSLSACCGMSGCVVNIRLSLTEPIVYVAHTADVDTNVANCNVSSCTECHHAIVMQCWSRAAHTQNGRVFCSERRTLWQRQTLKRGIKGETYVCKCI